MKIMKQKVDKAQKGKALKGKPMGGEIGAYNKLKGKDLELEKSNYKKFGDGPGSGPSIDKSKPAAPKAKSGGKVMIKRKDGSVSQRGLWDNIRAAKGSGKKPTAAMLKQEKKIKAKSK